MSPSCRPRLGSDSMVGPRIGTDDFAPGGPAMEPTETRFTMRRMMGWIAVAALVFAWLASMVNADRKRLDLRRRIGCASNARMIGLAVLQYQSANDAFP